MSEISPEKLQQRILDSGLLDSRQMESIWSELGSREATYAQFVSLLQRRELLTNFQLDRLIKGERGGYFYGDYKVLYSVGAGTFARVYRAVHKSNGKVVAIKALRKRFREDKGATDLFLREGTIGAQLRHPNIVPIYEVGSDPSPYLVMEFVEGQNLREFLKVRKKFPPLESMRLGVDIIAGLAYAVEKGMTHRDLKTSNVLVTSRGRAKLVDFGLAGLDEKTESKDDAAAQRTIDYAGLERACGVRSNDNRSDLYFVGCIIYNLVTGVPALVETRERVQRLSVQRYESIKPILTLEPGLPRLMSQFVSKAIELKAERRFQSAAEMLDEAKRVLASIEAGDVGESSDAARAKEKPTIELEGAGKAVLVVESRTEIQDVLRDLLKKNGYRVLVISDPQRAIARFEEHLPSPADAVIFSGATIGAPVIDSLNTFVASNHTRHIPTILLLDQNQSALARKAQLSDRNLMLSMPFRARELRQSLLRLLKPDHPSLLPGGGSNSA